jgi:hypothetical protein
LSFEKKDQSTKTNNHKKNKDFQTSKNMQTRYIVEIQEDNITIVSSPDELNTGHEAYFLSNKELIKNYDWPDEEGYYIVTVDFDSLSKIKIEFKQSLIDRVYTFLKLKRQRKKKYECYWRKSFNIDFDFDDKINSFELRKVIDSQDNFRYEQAIEDNKTDIIYQLNQMFNVSDFKEGDFTFHIMHEGNVLNYIISKKIKK